MTVAGARYEVTEIRYALFPTRAGRLIIEPAEVSLPDNPFSRFDRFFGRSTAPELPRLLRTGALTLEVMALPEPRPAAFSGIVATRATLAARLSQARVPRGEPLTLTVELQADGFLKGLAGVPLPSLPGIEVHDAGDRFEVDRSGDRLVSHYREEKVLVPQDEGTVHLPPVQFSYFDPTRGRYATAQAEPGDLSVGPGGAARSVALADGADARAAREPAVEHPRTGCVRGCADEPLPARPGWWAALLVPPLALGVLDLRRRRERRLARDPAARRRTLALAEARRRLRRAVGGDGGAGAPADIAHAIVGYVGDCTDRPATAVGAGELREHAAALGLAEVGERLAHVLRACDEARFAGRDSSASPAALAAEAERLLMRAGERQPQATAMAAAPAARRASGWSWSACSARARPERAKSVVTRPPWRGCCPRAPRRARPAMTPPRSRAIARPWRWAWMIPPCTTTSAMRMPDGANSASRSSATCAPAAWLRGIGTCGRIWN